MDRASKPLSTQALSPASPNSSTPIRIQSSRPPRAGNFFINLSTSWRLTLGFLAAALIAALVAGTIGLLHSQSLYNQSNFDQNLLMVNTQLTTGAEYLELMSTETRTILDDENTANPSQETLNTDVQALKGLTQRYNGTLTDYLHHDLLVNSASQSALIKEAGHAEQITEQQTLASSTLRTWNLYQNALNQFLQQINGKHIAAAANQVKTQVEPTNSDALSSLRSLIQLNGQLANSAQDAAQVEGQNQLVTTIIASIIAFLLVLLIGWFISGTIVQRLTMLRQVTMAVEQGHLNRRVLVIGRDEIADVSASVNAMLETITSLLEETRKQRDALTNAAEHLFSDMRVVSAGDLRINAPVSNDPIGMLANAFNFTVGRFRRFVQRTRTTAEQLDVVARQEIERSAAFIQALQNPKGGFSSSSSSSQGGISAVDRYSAPTSDERKSASGNLMPRVVDSNDAVVSHIRQVRQRLQTIVTNDSVARHLAVPQIMREASSALERLHRLPGVSGLSNRSREEQRAQYEQEIRLLDSLFQQLLAEVQRIQGDFAREVKSIDRDIVKISVLMREQARQNESPEVVEATHQPSQVFMQEFNKLSTAYANDINMMAQQLNVLAQEIRNGITTFQLDSSNDNEGAFKLPPLPPLPQTPSGMLGPIPPNTMLPNSQSLAWPSNNPKLAPIANDRR